MTTPTIFNEVIALLQNSDRLAVFKIPETIKKHFEEGYQPTYEEYLNAAFAMPNPPATSIQIEIAYWFMNVSKQKPEAWFIALVYLAENIQIIDIKRNTLRALSHFDDRLEPLTSTLIQALTSPDDRTRLQTVYLLEKIAKTNLDLIRVLSQHELGETDSYIKGAILRILAFIPDTSASFLEMQARHIKAFDHNLRANAAWSFNAFMNHRSEVDPTAFAGLLTLLSDSSPETISVTASTFASISNKLDTSSLEKLILQLSPLLQYPHQDVRESAFEALDGLNHPQSKQVIADYKARKAQGGRVNIYIGTPPPNLDHVKITKDGAEFVKGDPNAKMTSPLPQLVEQSTSSSVGGKPTSTSRIPKTKKADSRSGLWKRILSFFKPPR
jgi:hypothetical protein